MNQKLLNRNKKFSDFNRWMYVFLGIIIMMSLGTVYSYSVFRGPIEAVYSIGTTQSGMPYMFALAFYALFMFLSGKHLDKFKPRLIMIMGGLLVSLGWILSSFAPNIFVLTITYGMMVGAGVGIIYGVPMSVVARWFPEKKGLAVGMVLIGFGLSPLVTAPLARILIEQYGIMQAFQILGLTFGGLITLLALPFKHPPTFDQMRLKIVENSPNVSDDLNTSSMLQSKSFKGVYINFIIGTTIGLMLIGLTSNIGTELIGLSPRQVALLMALFAIFNGLGRPVFGLLTDKLSTQKAMYISFIMIISAALLMLLSEEGTVTIFIVSFSIFWFNLGGWLAIAPTSTLVLYGTKHYSQNYGVVFTAYGIGAITGVLTSGILIDLLQNYYYVFYYVIALCSIGFITTLKLIKGA